MATVAFMLIAASVLIGYSGIQAEATAYPGGGQVINLGGKVMCQDCTKGYTEWSQGSQPIKGSRVSVTCMDDRNRITYYGSDETDEQGQFNMVVNKYMINGKELVTSSCLVRLVSSPHLTCNIPTDFAGGHTGVKLPARPTVVYRDLVRYELGTLFYTTPRCDKPASGNHESFECNGNNNY